MRSFYNKIKDYIAIFPFDGAHYALTDLSRITMELWEIPVFSLADGAIIDQIALLFGTIIFPLLRAGAILKRDYEKSLSCKRSLVGENN